MLELAYMKNEKMGGGAPVAYQDVNFVDGGEFVRNAACIETAYEGEGIMAGTSSFARWAVDRYIVTIELKSYLRFVDVVEDGCSYRRCEKVEKPAPVVFRVSEYGSARAARAAAKKYIEENADY